ncbi:tetratricopeptide repeat protein [Ktedonobacteria bacterium brp13]|nr:tetratricopeptide repeat protein [Ktedonobacteria bacterium brp13]
MDACSLSPSVPPVAFFLRRSTTKYRDSLIKGQLSFLLYTYYKSYYELRSRIVWEKREEHEQLLLQAASLFDHHQIQEELSSYYLRKQDFARAVYHHLRGCILLYQCDEDAYSQDHSNYSIEDEEDTDDKEDKELSIEQSQAIHETAIALLQEHQSPSLIRAVFLPFYRSFWYQILYDRDMHQAIVAVTSLLMVGASEEETTNERWDYAYSLDELGEHDKAVQAFRVYLKYHPDSDLTLNNLAVILENNGELAEALDLMEQALALNLNSEEERYQRNIKRMKKRLEDLRQENARGRWNQLIDTQKKLLYFIYEQDASDWQHLSLPSPWDEPTPLKEHWETFLHLGAIQETAEHGITIDTNWLPLVTQEGLLLLLCDDILKATHPRKKNPWCPTLEDFSPEARASLNKTQCLAFHKAVYSRLQTTERKDLLATVFLPFYRSIWRPLLLQKDLFEQVVETTAILTESLPEYTHSERWDYAYYGLKCAKLS